MHCDVCCPLWIDRHALFKAAGEMWETHTGEYETPRDNNADGDPDAYAQLLRNFKNAFIEKQYGYLDGRQRQLKYACRQKRNLGRGSPQDQSL